MVITISPAVTKVEKDATYTATYTETLNTYTVAFVDADDWIEPDMFEVMVRTAEAENADIVECGFYTDYPKETWTWQPHNGRFSTEEALFELLHGRRFVSAAHDVVLDLAHAEFLKDLNIPGRKIV